MKEYKICVIGLGYVGLPLARLFSTKYATVGFDMNQSRVDALMTGHDSTLEVSDELLQAAIANGFKCTTNLDDIRDCNVYIVAVPTPALHLLSGSNSIGLRAARAPALAPTLLTLLSILFKSLRSLITSPELPALAVT